MWQEQGEISGDNLQPVSHLEQVSVRCKQRMTNVIFMVNLAEEAKPGRNTPYTYSKLSWKHYADRCGAEIFVLEERIFQEEFMNANWHKTYALKLLDSQGIDYDKVLIVDGDTIVHPEAPNIFDAVGRSFCAVHNEGSYDWVFRSYENYSKMLFGGFEFDPFRYFNSGFMIVNKDHKEFMNQVVNYYLDNYKKILHMQRTYGVGTDQPVLNFIAHMKLDDILILPYEWNMQEMARREILTEDLLFTKYGWVYHFNGINPHDHVGPWMKHTYEKLYADEYVND